MSKKGKTGSRIYGLLEVWHWDMLRATAAIGRAWHRDGKVLEPGNKRETTLKARGIRQDVVVTRKVI